MEEQKSKIQVQMIWPVNLLSTPAYQVPAGYRLRAYQPGDEPRFYELMALASWPGWDDAKLKPWLHRILPEGWIMALSGETGEIVASCMATHDPTWREPFCGEVGWTVTDPAHTGRGLGTAVVGAVTERFLSAGYRTIHLYTEPWRLAALKIYLKLGYVPLIADPEDLDHWQKICQEVDFHFSPSEYAKR